jgi:hypothetical protein
VSYINSKLPPNPSPALLHACLPALLKDLSLTHDNGKDVVPFLHAVQQPLEQLYIATSLHDSLVLPTSILSAGTIISLQLTVADLDPCIIFPRDAQVLALRLELEDCRRVIKTRAYPPIVCKRIGTFELSDFVVFYWPPAAIVGVFILPAHLLSAVVRSLQQATPLHSSARPATIFLVKTVKPCDESFRALQAAVVPKACLAILTADLRAGWIFRRAVLADYGALLHLTRNGLIFKPNPRWPPAVRPSPYPRAARYPLLPLLLALEAAGMHPSEHCIETIMHFYFLRQCFDHRFHPSKCRFRLFHNAL